MTTLSITSRHNRQGGFSLLEVLVVLVIVGFVSAALVQALSQVLSVRTRLGPFIDRSEDTARVGEWYRRVISGVVPAPKDSIYVFRGTSNEIIGLTLSPLTGAVGMPTPFRMVIENESTDLTVLRSYAEGGPALALARWPVTSMKNGAARFLFFDGTNWSDHWPLEEITRNNQQSFGIVQREDPPQLPKLIRVDLAMGPEEFVLVGAPRGPVSPQPKLSDIFTRR